MVLVRYLDVCLVLATAPFVLIAGLPLLGYLLGAAAWILTRARHRPSAERALRSATRSCSAGCRSPA